MLQIPEQNIFSMKSCEFVKTRSFVHLTFAKKNDRIPLVKKNTGFFIIRPLRKHNIFIEQNLVAL
jgi:hypothetical protein